MPDRMLVNVRENRDLLIVLQTKLEVIESLVSQLRDEYKSDHDEIIEKLETSIKDMQLESEKSRKKIEDEVHRLEGKLVSKDVFQPVKAIVYGLAGTTLIGVLYALLKLINLGGKL